MKTQCVLMAVQLTLARSLASWKQPESFCILINSTCVETFNVTNVMVKCTRSSHLSCSNHAIVKNSTATLVLDGLWCTSVTPARTNNAHDISSIRVISTSLTMITVSLCLLHAVGDWQFWHVLEVWLVVGLTSTRGQHSLPFRLYVSPSLAQLGAAGFERMD